MSSAEWDLYDYDMPSTSKKPVTKKTSVEKKKSAEWDLYDYEQEKKPTQPTDNPFAVKEIPTDEYKNMSIAERIQYAKDLEREQRYEASKSFTKNLASGLTFGATENIEALKPQEGENPVAAFGGQALGATLPILGSSKLVGYGLSGLSKLAKNGPKILQYLNNFAHAFGTGSVYESGKQGIKFASGEEVDLSQIPVKGLEFVAADAFLRGLGTLGHKFIKLSPQHQAQILEEGIIPSDLPKSQYETAEEMLSAIQKQKKNRPSFPPGGGPDNPPPGAPPSQLRERVQPIGQDLGLRPVPQRTNPELADQVGDVFSPNKFYNTTQGGHAFRNEIMNIDENVYRGVNELYRHSRELNGQINEIHPQLAGRLQNRIAELESIPEPSDVQKRLLRASQNIRDRLVTLGDNGEITGYQPINNQVLIDQVQSLRQIIDYDFAHGNTKNIFRPLINELQDSALRAAENSATPEAAQAINEARNAYRMWVEAFDNDYVRPFRDASNQDYSKLFKSALDIDESNMLRRILNTTPRGKELVNASTRDIVEKHLSKYLDNPRNVNPREFDKSLRELEAVITPDQSKEIQSLFRESNRRPNFRARQQIVTPSKEELAVARYEGKQPEDIQKMMNTRSGIRQLREDFKDSDSKRQLFNRLGKQKMRSILREGNIEKDFTGNDLYKFLNKEKNYEIFSEILGDKETEALRLSAKEIGESQVKSEMRKKSVSRILNKMAVLKSLEVITSIL